MTFDDSLKHYKIAGISGFGTIQLDDCHRVCLRYLQILRNFHFDQMSVIRSRVIASNCVCFEHTNVYYANFDKLQKK